MKTANKDRDYVKYGELHFTIKGEKCKLNVYQSLKLIQDEKYKNFLFLPFTDLTSNVTSYGGGRYIDLLIPAGKKLTLDFNQAYNPYCAYAVGYSCPIPPKENFLELKVEAGVRYTDIDH